MGVNSELHTTVAVFSLLLVTRLVCDGVNLDALIFFGTGLYTKRCPMGGAGWLYRQIN
jgi:hypothetical protein